MRDLMKTPDQRGPYGRWLLAARLSRDLRTAEEARQALAAAGINIAKSTYAEYESGTKQPSKNHLPELERFYGPFVDSVAAPDRGDTASGLADLTAAISRLAEQIDLDRQERQAARQELYARLGRLEEERGQWARLDERSIENRQRIEEMADTLASLAAAALRGQETEAHSMPTARARTRG